MRSHPGGGSAMRLRRWMANRRLRTKFVLILMAAMLLVFAITLATMRIPYAAYDQQLYNSSTQLITLFADRIQGELENIEALSFRMLADNVLQESLRDMLDKPITTSSWMEARTNVGERISYFSVWSDSVLALRIKTANGISLGQALGTTYTMGEITPAQVAQAAEEAGRPVWQVEDGDPARLYLVREIREVEWLTLRPLATLLIQMDLKGLVNKHLTSMDRRGTPLTCAIYSGDTCLYASDEGIRQLSPGEDGYAAMNLDGRDVLCVRYTAPNGWRYVALQDYEAIEQTISSSVRLTMGVLLGAMVLALLLGVLLISSVVRHLKILVDKFDAFALTGKPVPEDNGPYLTRRDEIGQLHRHFDKMTRDYDRMTRDNYEQQRLLQEKQMQQLRAQVRPHFLYNTLESIYCLAKNAQDERIAAMTDALGKMLRASLNDKRDVVSVEEDLQITKEYLRIQLLRYGDRLRVEYDLEESLLCCRIPAMTIQPLVENAVHHAAEEMLETCVIRIGGRAEDGAVDLYVEDNGPGMDEDMLAKLESGEIKPEGMGIGLRNIHRRVQYAFSDRYGLRIQSQPHHTRIIIHLPDTRPEGPGGRSNYV